MQTDVDDLSIALPPDAYHSHLRERIVEHVFVGEMLRYLWRRGVTNAEVLRSEFDAGGYDLVVGLGSVQRHIQFKSSQRTSRTAEVTLSMRLAEKQSGCVVWVVVDDKLNLDHFLWFGGEPGEPLPMIDDLPVAKNVRANALGVKTARPNHRRIGKGRFTKLESLEGIIARLFGPFDPSRDPVKDDGSKLPCNR